MSILLRVKNLAREEMDSIIQLIATLNLKKNPFSESRVPVHLMQNLT